MPKWEKYLDEDADMASFEKFTKKKKQSNNASTEDKEKERRIDEQRKPKEKSFQIIP